MPDHVHNLKYLRQARQELRNNLTPEELKLWFKLKDNFPGYKFRRQHSIGNFVVDFYYPPKKLIIELDGSQHLDNKEYDKERTEYLESLGNKVIRFWNDDINKNINGVLMTIMEELER